MPNLKVLVVIVTSTGVFVLNRYDTSNSTLLVESIFHLAPLAQLVSASAHEAKLLYVHVRIPADFFFMSDAIFLLIIFGIVYFAIWSYLVSK